MTELASPWWLLLLPLVALVPFQRRLTGRLALAVPTTTGVRPGRSWRTWLVWVPPALRTLGLALVVFALARPRVAHQSVSVESEGLDILLAVDTSGSMQAEDMVIGLDSVSRLEAAKAVMAEFVEHRPHDRIGVVVFGEEAWTQVPLTLDHETLAALIGQIELGNAGAGCSPGLCRGLRSAEGSTSPPARLSPLASRLSPFPFALSPTLPPCTWF